MCQGEKSYKRHKRQLSVYTVLCDESHHSIWQYFSTGLRLRIA